MFEVKPALRNVSMSMDSQNRKKMHDLGRRLALAMKEAPKVREEVRRLQLEGFSLSLALSNTREERMTLKLEMQPPEAPPDPAFRLDGDDVSFLKSMRIDPTRRARRRR
jgi:hypothetical protein